VTSTLNYNPSTANIKGDINTMNEISFKFSPGDEIVSKQGQVKHDVRAITIDRGGAGYLLDEYKSPNSQEYIESSYELFDGRYTTHILPDEPIEVKHKLAVDDPSPYGGTVKRIAIYPHKELLERGGTVLYTDRIGEPVYVTEFKGGSYGFSFINED
jgi:hypothetical protein